MLSLCLSGCGTILSYIDVATAKENTYGYIPIYAGTIGDFTMIFSPLFIFGLVDMPLSIVADTGLVPFIFTINTLCGNPTPPFSYEDYGEMK